MWRGRGGKLVRLMLLLAILAWLASWRWLGATTSKPKVAVSMLGFSSAGSTRQLVIPDPASTAPAPDAVVVQRRQPIPERIKPPRIKAARVEPARVPPPLTSPLWVIVAGNTSAQYLCPRELAGTNEWRVMQLSSNRSSEDCVKLNEYFHFAENFWTREEDLNSTLLHALLYAIKNGAEAVHYVTQFKDLTANSSPRFDLSSVRHGLLCTSPSVQLSSANNRSCQVLQDAASVRTPLPCTLTRHRTAAAQVPCRTCDGTLPSVAFDKGTYLHGFSVNNVLIKSHAFWALPLLDLPVKELELWYLMVQNLLWISGSNIMVINTQHGLLWDDPGSNVHFSEALGDFRKHFSLDICDNMKFKDCIKRIWKSSLSYHNGNTDILNKFLNWIDILEENMWVVPQLPPERIPYSRNDSDFAVNLRADDGGELTESSATLHNCLILSGVYHKTCDSTAHDTQTDKLPQTIPFNTSKTNGNSNTTGAHSGDKNTGRPDWKVFLSPEAQWRNIFRDILLVIAFNNPHYEAIPYTELLYRPVFPNILYCGPEMVDKEHTSGLSLSFVAYNSTPKPHLPGSFNYECLALAIQMDFNVQGYMLISDDVLLDIGRLVDLPRDQIWFMPPSDVSIGHVKDMDRCFLGACGLNRTLLHVPYQNETIALLEILKQNPKNSQVVHKCHQSLHSLLGENKFFTAYADIAYIPHSIASDFHELAQYFLEYKVFLEIALPTILLCLEPFTNIVHLPGLAVWDLSRNQPWQHLSTVIHNDWFFLHPTKWGFLHPDRLSHNWTRFFCHDVLPLAAFNLYFTC